MKKEDVRDTVSKGTPKKSAKIFFVSFRIYQKIGKAETTRKAPLVAQDTRAHLACQARPVGLRPPQVPSGLHFSSVCLFPKIKNLYILPEPVDHRITEKSSVSFLAIFGQIYEARHHVFLLLQQHGRRCLADED